MLPRAANLTFELGESPPPTDVVEDALQVAILATEILAKQPIRERTIREHLLVTDGKVRLRHFPVRNVRVRQEPLYGDDINAIYTMELVAPSTYEFTYTVGYRKDWLPAILYSVIVNLARYRLTSQVSYREEALTELQVVRKLREKAIADRPG